MTTATAIEVDDTVRYIGKKCRWIVGGVIDADTIEVYRITRTDYRTQHYISRPVKLNRVELVRKGNATDDAVAKLFAEMDAQAPAEPATPAVDPDATALFGAIARKIEASAPAVEDSAATAAAEAARRREEAEAARRADEDALVARRTAEVDRLVAGGMDFLSALIASLDVN